MTVIDDFNDFYDPAIKRATAAALTSAGVRVVEGDIRDAAAVESLFAGDAVDAVIHIAARAGVRPSIQDPRLYVDVNVHGTLNLLEACRRHGVGKFLLASTSSIYGVNAKLPFSEEDPVYSTLSPYAATKLCCEQLGSNYSRLYGMQVMCLRFFTVYGPRQRPDLAIHKFARRMMAGEAIDLYGDGGTRRDYTYVDDIVSGVWGALAYEATPFEIINLGESQTTTLARLVELLESALGVRARINRLPEQPGDVPVTYADISKARRLLAYDPRTPVEEGIPRFVHWLKNGEG